ncbi:hypothetical protein, partial [Bacteroides heparinolyticus]|uniref:hypothetical protein n=1 Tax=Prevotella heparinolytica TaxID=28113 RepID=UPI0035A1B483
GFGIERRKRHVPATVEADERAHGRAVVIGSGEKESPPSNSILFNDGQLMTFPILYRGRYL